jgi:hypothetical protein
MTDKDRNAVEPSVLDNWMAARAEKKLLRNASEMGGATGKGKAITHASLGLVFGILRDISVSVFTVRNIPPALGTTACFLIAWGILAIATSSTNIARVNDMWDDYPSMRPYITEAANDGIITRWENRELRHTLRDQIAEAKREYAQGELEHRMDKEQ